MNQARSIARNTAVLAGARLIERGGNLVLALIISRHLHASGLGIYVTAIAYFGVISTAAESGSTNLLVREIAKDKSKTNAYLVHGSVLAGSVGLVVTIAGFAAVPHLGYRPDLRHSTEVILLALVPGTFNTIQESVFVAHQRVEFETLTTLGSTLVIIGVSSLLLALGHGVVSLVIAFVIAEYLVTIVYFILINRYIARFRLEFSRTFARTLIRDIKPFAGSSLLQAGLARPEIIMLSVVGSETQVGYYGAALKVADLWQFLPSVYMINVFPVLSRAFHEGGRRAQEIQDRSLKYLLALGLPLAAGMIFAATRIIEAFFGDKFDPSAALLRILGANIVFYCIAAVLWRVLAARGEQGAVFRVQAIGIVVRLAGGYALITWLADTGAAVSMMVWLAVTTILLGVQVRRDGTPVRILRPAWRFALAAAVMGGVIAVLADRVGLLFLVLIGLVVYVGLVALVRAFSPEDRALFRRLLPRLAEREA